MKILIIVPFYNEAEDIADSKIKGIPIRFIDRERGYGYNKLIWKKQVPEQTRTSPI